MNDFRKQLEKKLQNPKYKEKWDAHEPVFQVIKTLIEARKKKSMTQKQLAERTGITQPDISRLENGRGNPSLRTLNNLARGLGMVLKVEFVDAKPEKSKAKAEKSKPAKSKAAKPSKKESS
jgi:transcriptional regulator with XRE-family HTH domain